MLNTNNGFNMKEKIQIIEGTYRANLSNSLAWDLSKVTSNITNYS
jgi:hypothetical protein